MKLAYILLRNKHINSDNNTEFLGVLNKVRHQKLAMEKCGDEVSLVLICYSISSNDASLHYEDFLIIAEANKNKRYTKLTLLLKEHKFDALYVRDVFYQSSFYKVLIKTDIKVFIEIQTDILSELKTTNKKRYIIEKLLARRYFRKCAGLVCVTNEIASLERKMNKKLPIVVIGNGYSHADEYIPYNDNGIVDLLFIGTVNLWNGVERLIQSVDQYDGKWKFHAHIVGYTEDQLTCGIIHHERFTFYGHVPNINSQYEIFKKADIGVGTLALYKKSMEEACPIKVRQYLFYGLPIIIGYKDIDLPTELPFVFQLSNDCTPLPLDEIYFFYAAQSSDHTRKIVIDYFNDRISYEHKALVLNKFIKTYLS